MRTVLLLLSLFGADALRRGTSSIKIAETTKSEESGSQYGPLIVIGMMLDSAGLLLRMLKDELGCLPWASFIYWNIYGAVVMTEKQGISLGAAVLVLGQQFTSVGYGSSCPETNALRGFHNLHALWAVTEFTDMVNAIMNQFFGYRILVNVLKKACGPMVLRARAGPRNRQGQFISKNGCEQASGLNALKKYTVWFISVLGFSLMFGLGGGMTGENHFLDALYMVGMTLTTVGYGDLTPDEAWSKWLSYPFMTYMTWLTGISFSDGQTLYAAADLSGDFHVNINGEPDGAYKAGCMLDFQPKSFPTWMQSSAESAQIFFDNLIGKPIGQMILSVWNMLPAKPQMVEKFLAGLGLTTV